MRTFRLLHDTPELKRGGIVHATFGGRYRCADSKYLKYSCSEVFYTSKVVEKQPYWFEEVEAIFVPINREEI